MVTLLKFVNSLSENGLLWDLGCCLSGREDFLTEEGQEIVDLLLSDDPKVNISAIAQAFEAKLNITQVDETLLDEIIYIKKLWDTAVDIFHFKLEELGVDLDKEVVCDFEVFASLLGDRFERIFST